MFRRLPRSLGILCFSHGWTMKYTAQWTRILVKRFVNLKFEQNKSVYQDNNVISTKASYGYDFVGIWDARFRLLQEQLSWGRRNAWRWLKKTLSIKLFLFSSFFSKHNTQGINCEKCKEYFYRSPGRNQSDVDACQGNERKHGLYCSNKNWKTSPVIIMITFWSGS